MPFDLDPASPGHNVVPWVPVEHHYTSDGLERQWFGFIWLNPPYGRDVLPLWLEKFARHGDGIALVPERTSTRLIVLSNNEQILFRRHSETFQ